MGSAGEFNRVDRSGDDMDGDLGLLDKELLLKDGAGNVVGRIRRNGNNLEFYDVATGAWQTLSSMAGGDHVSISAADTTPEYLETKLTEAAGTPITLTKVNAGANEHIEVDIDNIDITLLADKIAGQVMVFDALGAPTVLGPGAADEYLRGNGAGAAPSFEVPLGITDENVKVSAADTTAAHLNPSILVTSPLAKAIGTPAGDETLNLSISNPLDTTQYLCGSNPPTWQVPVNRGVLGSSGNFIASENAAMGVWFATTWALGTRFILLDMHAGIWGNDHDLMSSWIIDVVASTITGAYAYGSNIFVATGFGHNNSPIVLPMALDSNNIFTQFNPVTRLIQITDVYAGARHAAYARTVYFG